MKKTLLVALLLLSMLSYSQETFVNKYTLYRTQIDSVKSELKPIKVVVVFNAEKTTDIIIYSPNKTTLLYRTGEITDGKTNNGSEYQLIDCVDSEKGYKYEIQLLKETVRIFINDSPDFIEYY
jgi:hypothetical protein